MGADSLPFTLRLLHLAFCCLFVTELFVRIALGGWITDRITKSLRGNSSKYRYFVQFNRLLASWIIAAIVKNQDSTIVV